MLPKSQRLNLKKDFKWVASGKKLETKYLKLFLRYGDNSYPRVGVATSGQIFKKASQRNRARRLVYVGFERLYYKLPQSVNIVALPKAEVVDVKSDDLSKDLESKLKDEKLIS